MAITPTAKTYKTKFIEAGPCAYSQPKEMTVLITQETLFKMANTFKGKPVIINHVDEQDTDEIVGYINSIEYNEFDGWFYADFLIFDEHANELISKGWTVSCAYEVTEWGKGGEYHSIPYEQEVINGEYVHLALVDNPRYEKAQIFENSKEQKQKEKTMGFKLFQKKEVQKNSDEKMVVEIGNEEVLLSDLVTLFKNEKEDEKAEKENSKKLNSDDEVEIDGEKVKIADLINCYKRKNEADDDSDKKDEYKKENSDDEDEDKDKKENSDDEDEKDKEVKENFKKLKNAKDSAKNVVLTTYVTLDEKVAAGKNRYGSKK